MSEIPTCAVCGEPMPPGEEMFKYHGYSGPCPKLPLPKEPAPRLGVGELDPAFRAYRDGEISEGRLREIVNLWRDGIHQEFRLPEPPQ